MSFQSKIDYFGLADDSIVVTDHTQNKSASVATATNEEGSIVAHEVYGTTLAPSNTYKIKADVSDKDFDLGTYSDALSSEDTTGYGLILTNVQINTGAGSEPSIQASGESVNLSSDGGMPCLYKVNIKDLTPKHHAQILSVNGSHPFTLSGDCYATQINYTINCNVGKATKDGVVIASDITEGTVECQVTMVQTSSSKPNFGTCGDWVITSPLTQTAGDAAYPTWTVTLTLYLAKTQETQTT